MRQQPSMTAQAVATNIVYLAQDPTFGALVPPDHAAAIRRFMQDMSGRYARAVRNSSNRFYRWYLPALERFFIAGISLHQTLRKRWLEQQIREALEAGVTQVVALGAGFDPLSTLLHREFPDVRFYEIDHPATQQPKQAAIAKREQPGANLTLLPVDFTQTTLAQALEWAPGYDTTALTLFSAEGVLMYLSEDEVRTLLQTLRARSAPGSRFIGTLIEPDPADGGLRMRGAKHGANRVVELALKMVGEPLRWGIAPAALPTFLESERFRLLEQTTTRAVLTQLMPTAPADTPMPEGEYLFAAVAE